MNIKLDDSWKKHLNHHINSKGFKNLVSFVKTEYKDHKCHPKGGLIFSSECGTPTNNRCPRCNRYACGSCLGSRTYKGRKVCDGCNRSMSGD